MVLLVIAACTSCAGFLESWYTVERYSFFYFVDLECGTSAELPDEQKDELIALFESQLAEYVDAMGLVKVPGDHWCQVHATSLL